MDLGFFAIADIVDKSDLGFDVFDVARAAVDIDFRSGLFEGFKIDLIRLRENSRDNSGRN
jgi:hypothetical protein